MITERCLYIDGAHEGRQNDKMILAFLFICLLVFLGVFFSLLFCGVFSVFRWSQLSFWVAIHEVTDLSSTRQYLALHSGSFLIQLK